MNIQISEDPSPKLWWLIEDNSTVLAFSSKEKRTAGLERSFLNNNRNGHHYEIEALTAQEAVSIFGLSHLEMNKILNLDAELLY